MPATSRADTNLTAALRSLQETKKDLEALAGGITNSMGGSGWRKLLDAMAHLAFAEGVLFAETSLTGDDWRKLIDDLET